MATGVWSTVDFMCRSLIKCLCVEVLLHSFSNAEQLEGETLGRAGLDREKVTV